jgi:hypothetical protein
MVGGGLEEILDEGCGDTSWAIGASRAVKSNPSESRLRRAAGYRAKTPGCAA